MAKKLKTVEVVGSAGLRRINETELPFWKKKGYKLASEADDGQAGGDTGDGSEGSSAGGADPGKLPDYGKCKVDELKGYAAKAGIKGASTMKKDELVAALTEAKYVPIDGQGVGDGGE